MSVKNFKVTALNEFLTQKSYYSTLKNIKYTEIIWEQNCNDVHWCS